MNRTTARGHRKARIDLGRAAYFGDGPWDVRATAALGIPMVGIGRRCRQLRDLGVRFAFRDYTDPDGILSALALLRTEGANKAVPAACDNARP